MNETVPTVETMRLMLRGWRESDVEPLGRILADEEVTRFLFDGRRLDATEVRAAYDRRVSAWRERGLSFWAVELKETGEFIGWAGLQHVPAEEGYVGEVEVGWTLERRCWRHGFATEAGAASLGFGFGGLGLERIVAFHAPGNARSERVMERLGMEPAGEARDLRDGCVSRVRTITAAAWAEHIERRSMPNPHGDPQRMMSVIGYDSPPGAAVLSPITPEDLHAALLAALVRSWPGAELPGEPRMYEARGDAHDVGIRVSAERSSGGLPLLVVTALAEPRDAGERLRELHTEAAREGVWLHADVAMRHRVEFPELSRADSLAFDVPTPHGRRRIFATRHPRILDEEFLAALHRDDDGGSSAFG